MQATAGEFQRFYIMFVCVYGCRGYERFPSFNKFLKTATCNIYCLLISPVLKKLNLPRF